MSATPAPADAHGLGEARLHAFLVRQHYTGRQKSGQLLAKLRRAPEARVGELELRTRRALVLGLVATIKQINEQIKQLERQIATAIREHPDGAIFTSLFKKPNSVICAAELLAEIGDCRGRYPTRDTLAADAAKPPSRSSPATQGSCFRWACNKRLRQAFVTLADTSRHHNPWAHDLYAAAIARGHDHPPRDPHPRPWLVPNPMALLAGPDALRSRPPPRPATPHHRHYPHLVGPRARHSRHPADARRRRPPRGGPQGRAQRA